MSDNEVLMPGDEVVMAPPKHQGFTNVLAGHVGTVVEVVDEMSSVKLDRGNIVAVPTKHLWLRLTASDLEFVRTVLSDPELRGLERKPLPRPDFADYRAKVAGGVTFSTMAR